MAEMEYAGFWRRVVAAVIDIAVLTPAMALAGYILDKGILVSCLERF